MNSRAQLVLTHGTSDLQILLRDDQGKLWRAMPDKTIVRRFHEWLLEQQHDAEIIDTPSDLLEREAEAVFTDWSGHTFGLRLPQASPDARPERGPDGCLQLMLPKIEPVLRHCLGLQAQPGKPAESAQAGLARALQNAGVRPAPLGSALVLSTDRGSEAQEPVATCTFLKRWLVKKGLPETAISECVFLHPGERLESRDSPLAPVIAERIERALRDFYDRQSTLLIASMGGLPPIKPLLAELAVLLAGDKAQNLFKTEHGALGLLTQTPMDALRVRRQCLEQVRRGALLDAWAMAAPFHDDPDARGWLRPLEQAARLLNGNPVDKDADLPALQHILGHARQATCLLVAIRVETALQTERWLEAINGSLTFLEAAFHDAIHQWAKEALEEYRPRRRYMRFRTKPDSRLLNSPALTPWSTKKGAEPLAYQANMVGEAALSAWDDVLGNVPLHKLREVIHNPTQLVNGRTFRLADYRNFNTHGVLTQDEIDEAVTRFMGADLWSQGVANPAARPKPGRAFLGRKLVGDVIGSLILAKDSAQQPDATPAQPAAGPESPAPSAQALYQTLLQQIEAKLIDPAVA
ncbi:hypothetical protein [Thermomonas flagellata]|uniref:hypothetical protein n=1 Tax=Thermomonas flagellata TaxID=2888524 RepID=UPI001F03DA88|nr:hypothetical protein [Thermomonas flagellata]